MKRNKIFLPVILLAVTLACNFLFNSNTNVKPVKTPFSTPNIRIQPTSISPSKSPFQELPTDTPPRELTVPVESEGECDGYKWEIRPIQIERTPGQNGNDLITVFLAIHNGSQYWGRPYLSTYTASVITKDGEYYPRLESSIPGRYNPLLSEEMMIPTGFTLLGAAGWVNNNVVETYFTLDFIVPSNKDIASFYLQQTQIECLVSKTEYGHEDLPELIYSVDNLSDFILPSAEDLAELGSQPIFVPNLGTFELTGLSVEDGFTVLRFSFTNTSDSMKNGSIFPHIVGDDGIYRGLDIFSAAIMKYDGAYFANPGQTVDVNPIAFKIPPGVSNLKFIFELGFTLEDSESIAFEVYDLYP